MKRHAIRCALLTTMFLLILLSLPGCSSCSEQDAEEIAGKLADRLTDALDFEGGVAKDGAPPEGEAGEDAPQLMEVTGDELRVGAPFVFGLESEFASPQEVVKAIVAVEGASKYIEVDGSLFDGLMEIFGLLKKDSELIGEDFKLSFALQTGDGRTGLYMDFDLSIVDEPAQEIPEGEEISALSVAGENSFLSERPEGQAGDQVPQIRELSGPEIKPAGADFTVFLETDFDGAVDSVILTTPKNTAYKEIPVQLEEGEAKIDGHLDDELSPGDRLIFLWAFKGESGVGLYRSWSVEIVEDGSKIDGDDQHSDGDDDAGDGDDEHSDGDDEATDGDDDAGDGDDENTDGDDEAADGDDEATDGDEEPTDGDVDEDQPAPFHIWSSGYGDSSENDFGRDLVIAADGSTYLIGDFDNSLTFDDETITSLGYGDIFLAKLNPDGSKNWVKQFGDDSYQAGNAIALDGDGNIYITGDFGGTLNFSELAQDALTSAGYRDIYIAKLTADGEHLWSDSFGDTTWDYGVDIAVDTNDYLYLIGHFEGTVDFGDGTITSAGGADGYIASFESNGTYRWAKRYGSSANTEGCRSVATYGNSGVFLAGDFTGTLNMGGDELISAGGADLYLARLNPADGSNVWSDNFGDSDDQYPSDLFIDSSGGLLLTGYFHGGITFDRPLTSAGGADAFIARLLVDGQTLWSAAFGDSGTQVAKAVHTDSFNNICIAGYFNGEINFGGDNFVNASDGAVFMAMFASGGEHQWSKAWGATGDNSPASIALSGDNRVTMTGILDGPMYFDPLSGLFNSGGSRDIFLVRMGY